MTITPSWVARDPASLISRVATSFGRLGEPRASNRSSTALATLLTFCPPGPEERTKFSTTSLSSMRRSPAFISNPLNVLPPVDDPRQEYGVSSGVNNFTPDRRVALYHTR